MERIGYIRVSTEEQNEARQEVIMEQLDASKVFIEKLSGKDTNRPQLKAMLDYVREGDTVVVESYSRLARSTKDLLNIVDELSSKGVQFISQKENIDTTTPQGRLMLTIFAGLAQF
ncbi:MAG: recombinase family protein, partial [Eubacterium sp.]